MSYLILLLSIFVYSPLSLGNSYVGNGGNTGDLDLQVVRNQLRESWLAIAKSGPEKKICNCRDGFEGHQICEYVKNLSVEKAGFCESQLRARSAALAELVISDKIFWTWTEDPIKVRDGDDFREADAAADIEKNSITLNRSRFIEQKNYEKIFLLAHELQHLWPQDAKPLADEGPLGPFEGRQGARDYINSISAATVMVAAEEGLIAKYKSALKRSRANENIWFGAELGKSTAPAGTRYQVSAQSMREINARWMPSSFGFGLRFSETTGTENYSQTIRADEKVRSLKLGVLNRFHFFGDPLTFLGQSHLLAEAGLAFSNSEFTLADSVISDSDKAKFTTGYVSAAYMFPLINGIWLSTRIEASQPKVRYDNLDLEFNKTRTQISIGVSNGF